MLRRLSFSAALAALTVPVLTTGLLTGLTVDAAAADPGVTPTDDPGLQTELRKSDQQSSDRPVLMSRRAKRAAARAEDDTPLAVTIDQLTPSAIPERGVVRVSGTVTNNDTVPWNTINVYAFISDQPMTSAAQLDAAANTPADAVVGRRITDKKDKIPALAPGEHATYSFSVPRKLLRQSLGLEQGEPGVYWFGVHALGESPDGRDETADGRARTFLPMVPPARAGQLPTSVVIPLRHSLVYADDGSLDDLAGWSRTLSPGGRLRSMVDFGASSGDRTVTWVVDPGLVDAVRRLAEGNPPRSLAPNLQVGEDDGEDQETADPSATPTAEPSETPSPTGEPEESSDSPLDLDSLDPAVQATAQAAQAWLARLGEAMRAEDQVMTLPYGDVDVAAAAAHDPQLYRRAAARSGTNLPGFDVTTTPVVSSPSGYLSTEGIRTVDPAATILLTDAMFDEPAPPLADTEGRKVVVTSTGAAAGGPGPDSRTGMTALRQRLLSEAAVRFLRSDPTALTMMLPHDLNPTDGPTFFGGLDLPWLRLTDVNGVSSATEPTSVVGATLRYPKLQEEAQLDQANFDAADSLIRSGMALQSLLTLNNLVAGTVTDQALGTVSYSARARPIDNRAAAEGSRRWIDDRLGRVAVSAPRAVTLSSTSGRFQATVTNRLDQPVTVSLDAQSDDRLSIEGPQRVDVPANGREAVLLTARTNENGIHEVTLLVTDKRGVPLGARTGLTIRSAQVSNVIWLFMGVGTALLFGAIGVRLFRRIRNARRGSSAARSDAAGGGPNPAETDRQPAGAGSR